MASWKEIKARIKSVKNTGKITKAMELISTVKMKKAQASVLLARPFMIEATKILSLIGTTQETHQTLKTTHNTELLLLISSNKGLCGSYNINVFKETLKIVASHPEKTFHYITVGKRAKEFVLRTGNTLIADFSDIFQDAPTMSESKQLFRAIQDIFLSENYDAVRMVYGHYISAIRQQTIVKTLFPVSRNDIEAFLSTLNIPTPPAPTVEYTIEPDREMIEQEIIPFIHATSLHETLLESKASEHSARMVAMKNAKDSATKKTSLLTLSYNKARQAAITKEVSEIVSGVESMKQ